MVKSKKSTLSAWLIGILATLNIITLILLWIIYFQKNPTPQIKPVQREKRVMGMLQRELGLSPEQSRHFHNKRMIYFEHIQNLDRNLLELKQKILEESFSTPPDSSRIRELAVKIANIQAQKEIETVYHFNQLQKICDTKQMKQFRSFIYEILPYRERYKKQEHQGRRGQQRGMNRPRHREIFETR